MTDDEMVDYVERLHARWVASGLKSDWDRFAAARDAWLQGGGK